MSKVRPAITVTQWRRVTDQIKDRLDVLDVLEHLGWRASRTRKRATCGVCGGSEDIAVKQDIWHCTAAKVAAVPST